MQNPAAEAVNDMRQALNQVPKFARRRNHRVGLFVQGPQQELPLRVVGAQGRFGFTEHTRERAVNGVAGAIAVGVNRDAHIVSQGPVLPASGVHQVSFGLEKAHVRQR